MKLSRTSGKATRRPADHGAGAGTGAGAAPCPGPDGEGAGAAADDGYQPPAVLGLGPVWQVTLGSSSSGNADANSHYYW
jgi:hypothetical protein